MKKLNAARRISKTMCAIDGVYMAIGKRSGLKPNLFWLLYALDDGKPHTQKQICNDWFFPTTTINTIVKECEAAGYVRLEAVPGTRRDLSICLTDEGKAYAAASLKGIHKTERKIDVLLREKFAPDFVDELERFSRELDIILEAE